LQKSGEISDRDTTALIVDDKLSICESLSGVLNDEGWKTFYALSAKVGVEKFIRYKPNLVFLDVWLPGGMDGIEALQQMRSLHDKIPIVVMSGHGTIDTAVKVTKLGAYHFLEKPLSLEKLLPILTYIRQESKKNRVFCSHSLKGNETIIGRSVYVEKIKAQIQLIAPKNVSVLITGENGTGKEVVARSIHETSNRSQNPFIPFNCAAIPDELIESELFGHVQGAFTNALRDKKGRFETAHAGTLFLDEVADMSLKTQAKILRILQDQSFEKLGGNQTLHVDVRIIAATNKDLQQEIRSGKFREDLFYRLNVVPIHLLPLRRRIEDFQLLADYFLDLISQKLGDNKKIFHMDAVACLKKHDWPGNIRELKNLIERLSILVQEDVICAHHLPENILHIVSEKFDSLGEDYASFSTITLKEARNHFEKTFILEKLEENEWNVSRTAEKLAIERSHLHRKLKSYQIDTRRFKNE